MEFAKKGKEMVEQVRAMRSTLSKKQERKPPFFRRGPPGHQGGFERRYGRGGAQNPQYRDQPYQRKGQLQDMSCVKNMCKDALVDLIAHLGIV